MLKTQAILLVEDNPGDVTLTRRALKQAGVANELVVASDGIKALDYLFRRGEYATRNPADMPAFVLLDLMLPKLGGLEVLQQIRRDELTALLPVVILTSSREEEDINNGYKMGANSYIRKPVDFIEFSETVRQLCIYWLLLNEKPRLDRD